MGFVCRDCGSLNVASDQDGVANDYYSVLATLSAEIPSEQHCDDWLAGKGIGLDEAEQTATAMLASLRYDAKKGVWKRGSTEYVQIWATFRSWCLRGQRQNGARPGTSMIRKEGTRY